MQLAIRIGHVFAVRHYRRGRLIAERRARNLVVNAGLDYMLDKLYRGSSYTAAFYVGLKGEGTIAAGDTASSHAGWSEVTDYDDVGRPQWSPDPVSAQSLTSVTPIEYLINAPIPAVAGVFLITDSTKGGSSGTLIAAADFDGGPLADLDDEDTVFVTPTATMASA